MRRTALPALLAFALASHLPAQTAPAPVDGGTSETVMQSIFIPPLPDAPFALTLATEWVRPLGTDGNTVTLTNERHIARDRAGRVFQERVLLAPPCTPLEGRTNVLQLETLATHTALNCFVRDHICQTVAYNPTLTSPDLTGGTTKFPGATQQRKNLGKDVIEGQEAVGMRVTTTIDAGQFGNAKPVTVVREFWYSPALGINLRCTRDDPRSGKQTFTVTKISRDEPDPSLWQVPAGFTVADDAQAAKP